MARCQRPFIKNGVPCPCGSHCEPCRQRRASGWGFRIQKEADRLGSAFFITLTYATAPKRYRIPQPEPIRQIWKKPLSPGLKRKSQFTFYQPTKRLTADIWHLQKFIKRVRKAHGNTPVKYYGVSEYGDETFRPHYHIILMGIDLLRFIGVDQFEQLQRNVLQLDGKCHFFVESWKEDNKYIGNITIAPLTPATANYTLKYISKGRKIPQYKDDDRQPEKSLMSKGLGQSYITKEIYDLHNQDLERQYVVTDEGHKIAIPRYLKEQLYDSAERQYMSDYYNALELQKRGDMGEIELKRYHQKIKKKVEDSGTKNTYNHKGKI